MSFLPPLFQIALGLTVVLAAFFDVKERRIPNWVVLLGMVLGFALNGVAWGWSGLLTSAKGFGLALAVYFGMYMLRAMGAGDAKLMAAIGSITGAANWLGIMFCTAIFGGVLAVITIATKGRFARTIWNVGFILGELSKGRAPYKNMPELDVASPHAATLPHGVAVLCGVTAFLIASWIWAPR
jgi:prepilin peptidase CpaA